jgi:hypothetical protein
MGRSILSALWQGILILVFIGFPEFAGVTMARFFGHGVGWGIALAVGGFLWGVAFVAANAVPPFKFDRMPELFCFLVALIGIMIVVRFA